jgi:hypothetical protein
LEDDAAFHKAVGDYKNVVAHFFSLKKESWLPTVLHNAYYIDHYSDVNEFAKGRGAIHGHGTGYANTAVEQKIDDVLVRLGIDSYRALKVIDKFIDEHPETKARQPLEDDEELKHPFETLGKEGMDARRHFLSQSHDVAEILKSFDSKLKELQRAAAKDISYEMENQFGYSTTHVGKALSNWVKPGGQPGSGHRQTSSDMMTKAQVREKKVLQKFKFEQERELCDRRKDLTYHAFTHQCSDYCWKSVLMDVPYYPSKHGPLENNDRIISVLEKKAPDSQQIIRYKVFECRMNFGFQLCVPVFGDGTGGKLPVRLPYIAFDCNGQPQYSAARNHPRVVQEPVATFHWGANSDMQRFLTNSKSYDEVTRLGINQDYFIKSLNTLWIAGLEQNTGNQIAIDYLTGYQTKGSASTKEWCSMLQDLENTLLAKDKDPAVDNENGNATMKKLLGKYMHQIAKYQDVSKEEASFCLSGDQLRYNSMIVKTCSLNQVEFSDFKS